jgi:hypothetical protein
MKWNEKNIFLLDGAGALVSVFLLGVALPAIQPWLGMPFHILYSLATWALGCAIYSLSCHRLANHRNSRWLQGIMVANALYCLLTASLIVVYFTELTTWGIAYFVAEMPVILGLVLLERKVFRGAFASDGP